MNINESAEHKKSCILYNTHKDYISHLTLYVRLFLTSKMARTPKNFPSSGNAIEIMYCDTGCWKRAPINPSYVTNKIFIAFTVTSYRTELLKINPLLLHSITHIQEVIPKLSFSPEWRAM